MSVKYRSGIPARPAVRLNSSSLSRAKVNALADARFARAGPSRRTSSCLDGYVSWIGRLPPGRSSVHAGGLTGGRAERSDAATLTIAEVWRLPLRRAQP